MPRREGMLVEGEPLKRYKVNYDVMLVGSYDTAKEALDLLVTDWTKVFKEEGKMK